MRYEDAARHHYEGAADQDDGSDIPRASNAALAYARAGALSSADKRSH